MSFNPHRLKTQNIPEMEKFFKVIMEGATVFLSIFRPHDARILKVRVHAADFVREIGTIDPRGYFKPNASDAKDAIMAKTAIDALLPHLYKQGQQLDRLGSLCDLTPITVENWDGIHADPIGSVFEKLFLKDANMILSAIAAG